MKDNVELEIAPDGTIRAMYQDGIERFAEEMGGEISTSCRASDVEWEEAEGKKGWTVRSAYNKHLALRYVTNDGIREIICGRIGELVVFQTREDALKEEVRFFWELLAPKREGNDVK